MKLLFKLSRFKFLGLLAIDAGFFGLTNPMVGNSLVVIVGGLLLALTIYGLLQLLLTLAAVFIPLSSMVQKRATLFITLTLVLLLLMQSIGQLDLRDALAIIALGVVLFFYSAYTAKLT